MLVVGRTTSTVALAIRLAETDRWTGFLSGPASGVSPGLARPVVVRGSPVQLPIRRFWPLGPPFDFVNSRDGWPSLRILQRWLNSALSVPLGRSEEGTQKKKKKKERRLL